MISAGFFLGKLAMIVSSEDDGKRRESSRRGADRPEEGLRTIIIQNTKRGILKRGDCPKRQSWKM